MSNENKILWCPQHTPTVEQFQELIFEYGMKEIISLKKYNESLFETLSKLNGTEDLKELACKLYDICEHFKVIVLPIGSPAFMATFMMRVGIQSTLDYTPKLLFSHSTRVSEESINPETKEVVKTSVFKHEKFLEV